MDKKVEQSDPLHPVRGAAEYMGGVSWHSVNAWMTQGRLRRTKVGARTFIRQSELDRFIRDGGKAPSAESEQVSNDTAKVEIEPAGKPNPIRKR